jgi:hypothetical protein
MAPAQANAATAPNVPVPNAVNGAAPAEGTAPADGSTPADPAAANSAAAATPTTPTGATP